MATGGCEPTPQGRCRRHWQQLSRVICLNKCYESAREEEVRCRRQRLLGIFSQTNARIRAKKKGAISSVFDVSYHRSILYVINSSKEKERERSRQKPGGKLDQITGTPRSVQAARQAFPRRQLHLMLQCPQVFASGRRSRFGSPLQSKSFPTTATGYITRSSPGIRADHVCMSKRR